MFKKTFTKMLICDMVGIISHDNEIVYKTLFNTIKKFKPDLKMSQIEDFNGYKKTEVIKYFLYDDCKIKNPSLLMKLNKYFNTNLKYDYLNTNIKLIHPDLCLYFNELRKDNIKIALNTEYNKEIQDILIYKLNLKYCIDDYISSSEVNMGRPAPHMIYDLMDRNNIFRPEQVIKIGDTSIDVLEGKNAGCKTVGVLTGDNREKLEKNKPDFIVDNIIDIKFY
jgi:phosphoglycolate phosphatase-like HAD superfamily hydrolase